MNKTLEKLKIEAMRIRRDRGVLSAFCSFAISEIEKIGKNSGNRETTEDETISAVKKMIGTLSSNMSLVSDEYVLAKLVAEKTLLESILPQMVSIDKIREFMLSKWLLSKPTKGEVMKEVKSNFGSLVDMKEVGSLYAELYEGTENAN